MEATFTLPDGNPVTVIRESIAYYQPADDGTLIVFIGGSSLQLTESYEEVGPALNKTNTSGNS
ncbi:hypothetical protein [Novosphingobium sp. TCA1]|uniref:hypothetical protein n=1 Tax=Novosphingobium sp. TCA1 TaxID=2682474 RepID=UPI001308A73F|nr:hypothetical protein [Novosphingobium sp. TCA1]GFE77951.1 hypothetical protein NTCA1_56000 [Novosphingobium sp. TCA1]